MIAAKTAIVGLLLFAPAVLLFRLFVNVAVEELVGRSNAQIGFLPELARALPLKKKVMVFGSSMVQAGFEPLVFDKVMSDQGIESVSYNYGIGGLNPKYQELITRRIQEAFRRSDQKVDLTLIEFCPFQATKVRRHFTAFTDDQNVATLASNSELFRIMLEDPARGIHLLNIRYLRAGISAELLTTAVMIGISEEADDSPSPELLEASRRRRELQRQLRESLRKDVPENRTAPWDRRLRGGRSDKTLLSPETLELLQEVDAAWRHPEFLKIDLKRRIAQSDVIDLGFEWELIDDFVQMVMNLKSVSKHVAVVLLPRNTDWINYSPETQRRLDEVLESIARRTQVEIKNYQRHPQILPQHFDDTTHLSVSEGADLFTRVLAEDYVELLVRLEP